MVYKLIAHIKENSHIKQIPLDYVMTYVATSFILPFYLSIYMKGQVIENMGGAKSVAILSLHNNAATACGVISLPDIQRLCICKMKYDKRYIIC